MEVKFEAGSRNIKYKNDFDNSFIEIDFLQIKMDISMRPNILPNPRGILKQKKDNILKVLVPMMPSNRHLFWRNISENDITKDLTHEVDVDDI